MILKHYSTGLRYSHFFGEGFDVTPEAVRSVELTLEDVLSPNKSFRGRCAVYGAQASGKLAKAALDRLDGIEVAAFVDLNAKEAVDGVKILRPPYMREVSLNWTFLLVAVSPARQLSVLKEIHDRLPKGFPVIWLWENEYFNPADYEVVREPEDKIPENAKGIDPRGRLVFEHGQIFRVILAEERAFYREFLRSERFKMLSRMHLVPTEIVHRPDLGELVVRHPVLPSQRPHEWPPMLLKKAALFFTKFWRLIDNLNLSLQDAHDRNVMFQAHPVVRPKFVDLTSIGPARARVVTRPLLDEYLESWIYPMALYDAKKPVACREIRCNRRVRYEDVARLVPTGILEDVIHLRELAQDVAHEKVKLNYFLDGAQHYITSIHPISEGLGWNEQDYQKRLDAPVPSTDKESELLGVIKDLAPFDSVLDLGANRGRMSLVAIAAGAREVVAVDTAERLMDELAYFGWDSVPVLPLVRDVGDTWNIRPHDLVMALAILHHLVNAQGIPCSLALWRLSGLTKRVLVLEWVEPSDSEPLFKAYRPKLDYNLEHVRQVLSQSFSYLSEHALSPTRRLLVAVRS